MIVLNWKDKRGYTLVELIISMAILAIVGGAITLLMQSGSKSYSNTKAELDLQMESQTLMAQMSTMIMESNCVKYDKDNNTLALYQVELKSTALPAVSGTPGATPVCQQMKTVKDLKVIQFKDGKLYLNEHNTDAALPASGGSVSCTEDDLLSDYISDFKVDIDGNKVTVSFDMKSGKKTYKIDETTKVRNGMVVYP